MNDTTTRWDIDPMHTTVGFSVRHLMLHDVRGAFTRVRGEIHFDPSRPGATRIKVEIETASIDTRQAQRDAHLRSGDFFDAERYPLVVFEAARAGVRADGGLDLEGTLTLRGVTRDVALHLEPVRGPGRDHNGKLRMGATARGKIRRSDFGMTFNRALEAGGLAISDEIELTLDVSLLEPST